MSCLKDFIGKEIFVIAVGEDADPIGIIDIFSNYEDAIACLFAKDVTIDYETRVFHGVLAPAETLLEDRALFTKKILSIYIVAQDIWWSNDDEIQGKVIESQAGDVEDLAQEIETIIEDGDVRDVEQKVKTDIDNIYVVYGYEMQICLSIDSEEIDDNKLLYAKSIVHQAIETQKDYDLKTLAALIEKNIE